MSSKKGRRANNREEKFTYSSAGTDRNQEPARPKPSPKPKGEDTKIETKVIETKTQSKNLGTNTSDQNSAPLKEGVPDSWDEESVSQKDSEQEKKLELEREKDPEEKKSEHKKWNSSGSVPPSSISVSSISALPARTPVAVEKLPFERVPAQTLESVNKNTGQKRKFTASDVIKLQDEFNAELCDESDRVYEGIKHYPNFEQSQPDKLIAIMKNYYKATGHMPYCDSLSHSPRAFCYMLEEDGISFYMLAHLQKIVKYILENNNIVAWRGLVPHLKGKVIYDLIRKDLELNGIRDYKIYIEARTQYHLKDEYTDRAILVLQRRYRAHRNPSITYTSPAPVPLSNLTMSEARKLFASGQVNDYNELAILKRNRHLIPSIVAEYIRSPKHARGGIPFENCIETYHPEIKEILKRIKERDQVLRSRTMAAYTASDEAVWKVFDLIQFHAEGRLSKWRDRERDKLKFLNIFTQDGKINRESEYLRNVSHLPPQVIAQIFDCLPHCMSEYGRTLLREFASLEVDTLSPARIVHWFKTLYFDELEDFVKLYLVTDKDKSKENMEQLVSSALASLTQILKTKYETETIDICHEHIFAVMRKWLFETQGNIKRKESLVKILSYTRRVEGAVVI